jgi:hypothetical protein
MTMIAADYWAPWRAFNFGYPWLAPGVIVRLEQLIRPEWSVLELGAGGSTIWLSTRCRHVTSYETSQTLIEKLQARLNSEKVLLNH